MPGLLPGLWFSAVVALNLLPRITDAALLKAPKQSASSAPLKKGHAAIEAWIQKAVNTRFANKDAHFKAAAVKKLEKDVEAGNDVDDDGNADMTENEEASLDSETSMDSANADASASDALNGQEEGEEEEAERKEKEEERKEEGSSDNANEQIDEALNENSTATEDASKTKDDSQDGEDSDGMAAFVQRLGMKKNPSNLRQHSSFLAKSHAKGSDDGDDAANDNQGDEHDESSISTEDNMESNVAENTDEVAESETQNDEHDKGDDSEQDSDAVEMNLVQKPIREKDAGLQWLRLTKSHLATKAAHARQRASVQDQHSVMFRLRNAAADLEKSVQKYMHEDDEQAVAQKKVQRDLAEETMKLKQDVDHELSQSTAPAPAAAQPEDGAQPPKKKKKKKEKSAEQKDPYEMCKELCKYDKGMDADSCDTDCRSYVDTGGDVNSLKDFVTDETYNEQGGESMEKKFEKMTGKKVPDCEPTIDVDEVPTFESVDVNGDGELSRPEMDDWSLTACVPNELAHQVFDVADVDFDEKVSKGEWNNVGEDLKTAQVLDRYADKETQGEDEYEPVQLPEFHHIDGDGNKLLDKEEIMKMLKEEIKKRIPNMRDEDVDILASQHEDAVLSDMDKLDTDKDGYINEEEFNAAEDQNMGHELHEVAQYPNNLEDPDDLHRNPES